ncbi:MAG: gamma-glutamylcyclotransferase family protein [Pseudomonadota bacterium]
MIYFAYGSNLHPERLRRRVPSRQALGVAILSGHTLTFTKRGADGSGKCAIVPTDDPQASVYGVLYRMAPDDRLSLDHAEGVHGGGYVPITVEVTHRDGGTVEAFTYLPPNRFIDPALQPYDWYKALVVHGARHHALPARWVSQLEAVAAMADPDAQRASLNAQILASLR